MEKKQLIIAVLNKLRPYWNLAEGLLALMESQYLTNQTLDGLIHILATSIKTVENQSKKEQMEKGLNVLKKIRTAENIEEIEDEKAAQNLLDTIS